jgi:predicted small metal-binding protein
MEKKQYLKCNCCNFVTNDTENQSGILKKHLQKEHQITNIQSNILTYFTVKTTHVDTDIKKIYNT